MLKSLSFLFFLFLSVMAQADDIASRYERLTHDIRCMVCANQSIADSNATLAVDMRAWVQQALEEGMDDKAIQSALITRYGDKVLYKPRLRRSTVLLWVGPLLFVAVLLMWGLSRKARRNNTDALHTQPIKQYSTWLLSILFSIVGYLSWGGYHDIQAWYAVKAFDAHLKSLAQNLTTMSPEGVSQALSDLSDKAPAYPSIWAKLGYIYQQVGWWAEAEKAFERAYLATSDTEMAFEWANAQYFLNDGQLPSSAQFRLNSVLDNDASHLGALNLLAVDAFGRADYVTAKQYWQRMRLNIAPHAPLYGEVTQAIDKCTAFIAPDTSHPVLR